MVEVFKKSLNRRFYADRSSFAYVIWIVFTVSCILGPYFIAFSTRDFWKTEDVYREQPSVKFKRKIVMMLETQDPARPILYSTMPQYNRVVGHEFVRNPIIRVSESDTNLDGIIDFCNVSLAVNLLEHEQIHRVTLFLFYDALLQDRIRTALEGMVYIDHTSVLPGNGYSVNGDLNFHQLHPLTQSAERVVYQGSVLEPELIQSTSYVQPARILGDYFARNETLSFNYPYSYWESGGGNTFTINVQTRIPIQDIQYIPGPAETSKFAWIQYLAIFAPFYFIANKIRGFVYEEQIAPSSVILDTAALSKLHEF